MSSPRGQYRYRAESTRLDICVVITKIRLEMEIVPRIEFNGEDAQLNLADQIQCMQFIRDRVIPGCIENSQSLEDRVIVFRKITKNDSIQQSLERLESSDSRFVCLYAYGPHVRKLLSVVELLKKILSKKMNENGQPRQWNKLSCFMSVQLGRNELLEKRTRVPILISVIEKSPEASETKFELGLKGFTLQ